MPKAKTKSDKEKLASVYRICNAMQKRNGMSNDKKENFIRGISKKWGIGKSRRKRK
jgi:hypothetical protein